MKANCKSCKHFVLHIDPTKALDDDSPDWGNCQRYPKMVSVYVTHYCGEWKTNVVPLYEITSNDPNPHGPTGLR